MKQSKQEKKRLQTLVQKQLIIIKILLKELVLLFGMVYWKNEKKQSFAKRLKEIADAVAAQEAFSVIGGGETVDFINNEKYPDKFSFLYQVGRTKQRYISGKKLPGIEAINKYYEDKIRNIEIAASKGLKKLF